MKLSGCRVFLLVALLSGTLNHSNGEGSITLDAIMLTEDEDVGVVDICVNGTGLMMGNVTAVITIEDGTALNGSDYVSEQVDLMLLSEEMEVCFNVTILDDDAFEDDESFSIFLSTVDEDVPETIMEATITIRDDDILEIGWEQPVYVVNDSRAAPDAVICASILTGTLQTSIPDISVELVPSANISPGNDYGPAMPGYVRFTPSVNRSCVVIPIVDDFIFEEEVEEVYALLQLSDSTQRVELNPNITTIQIKGEDVLMVGFSSTNYTVNEGEASVDVEVFQFLPSFAVQFVVYIFIPGLDTPIDQEFFIISNQQSRYRLNLTLLEDSMDDDGQMVFTAMLAPTTRNDRIRVNPEEASITLLDSDEAKVGFRSSFYTLMETGSIEVCVQVQDTPTLAREVTVSLTTQDGTAIAVEDFSPISKELTFTRDDLLQCVLINATQDELVEGPENFSISLSSSSDINLVRDMATIILLDDDELEVQTSTLQDLTSISVDLSPPNTPALIATMSVSQPATTVTGQGPGEASTTMVMTAIERVSTTIMEVTVSSTIILPNSTFLTSDDMLATSEDSDTFLSVAESSLETEVVETPILPTPMPSLPVSSQIITDSVTTEDMFSVFFPELTESILIFPSLISTETSSPSQPAITVTGQEPGETSSTMDVIVTEGMSVMLPPGFATSMSPLPSVSSLDMRAFSQTSLDQMTSVIDVETFIAPDVTRSMDLIFPDITSSLDTSPISGSSSAVVMGDLLLPFSSSDLIALSLTVIPISPTFTSFSTSDISRPTLTEEPSMSEEILPDSNMLMPSFPVATVSTEGTVLIVTTTDIFNTLSSQVPVRATSSLEVSASGPLLLSTSADNTVQTTTTEDVQLLPTLSRSSFPPSLTSSPSPLSPVIMSLMPSTTLPQLFSSFTEAQPTSTHVFSGSDSFSSDGTSATSRLLTVMPSSSFEGNLPRLSVSTAFLVRSDSLAASMPITPDGSREPPSAQIPLSTSEVEFRSESTSADILLPNSVSTPDQTSITEGLPSLVPPTSLPALTTSTEVSSTAANSIFLEPSDTTSVFLEPSDTTSVSLEPSDTTSVSLEASVAKSVLETSATTSVFLEPSDTASVSLELSATRSVLLEPSATSVPLEPSATSVSLESSATRSVLLEPSDTTSVFLEPSATASVSLEPSATSVPLEPSVTSVSLEPSATSVSLESSATRSVLLEPSDTTSISLETSATSVPLEPSVTSVSLEPSATSVSLESSATRSVLLEPSDTTSISLETSATSVPLEPSVTSVSLEPSATSVSLESSATRSVLLEPSGTTSVFLEPSATASVSLESSATSVSLESSATSVSLEPSATSVSLEPSATSVSLEPSATRSVLLEPSDTISVFLELSTSVLSEPSATASVSLEQSATSVSLEPSATASVLLEPSATASVLLEPSTTIVLTEPTAALTTRGAIIVTSSPATSTAELLTSVMEDDMSSLPPLANSLTSSIIGASVITDAGAPPTPSATSTTSTSIVDLSISSAFSTTGGATSTIPTITGALPTTAATSASPTTSVPPITSTFTASSTSTLPTAFPTSSEATPTTRQPVCDSLFSLAIVPRQSHIVEVTLALTLLEHALLATPNSVERCRLEAKIVEAFELGWISNPVQRRKRQTSQALDSDLTMVGDLSGGAGVINFFIINGTDSSSPSYVPAATIVASFTAANIKELDTYPIIFPARVLGSHVTAEPPSSGTNVVLIAVVAALGGVLCLLVVVVIIILCYICCCCYRKKTGELKLQETSVEEGDTYSESKDFTFRPRAKSSTSKNFTRSTMEKEEDGQEEEEREVPKKIKRKKDGRVTMAVLANKWAESGEQRTSNELQAPDGLFERITHYNTTSPANHSPPIRNLRSRLRNTVAPSPSVSNKSQSSEGVATPHALQPQPRPSAREVEAKRLRQEALKEQEEQEERLLKKRKKATLERLLHNSQAGDPTAQRKRRGQPPVAVLTPSSLRSMPTQDMVVGDIELAASASSHNPSTTPRRKPHPHKKRHHRKKHNKIGILPVDNTDASDTVDVGKPRPYHKSGRNQRGRRFSQPGFLIGHNSRSVAFDAQRELAWMDMGDGGIQLMKIQPLTDPTPFPVPPITPRQAPSTTPGLAPPTTPHSFLSQTPHPYIATLPPLVPGYLLPPLSSTPHPPNKEVPHPHTKQLSITEDKLPALTSEPSHAQQQLQNYFKIHEDMERLGIDQTTPTHKPRVDSSKTPEEDTPTQHQAENQHLVEGDGRKSRNQQEDKDNHSSPIPGHTNTLATPPPRSKLPSSTRQLLQEALPEHQPQTISHLAASLPQQQPAMQTTPYQLYSPPNPSHRPYVPHSPRPVLWSPSEPHPMAPPTGQASIQLSPADLTQLRRQQDYRSSEHRNQWQQWADPYQQLSSQYHIQNQTDPF